MLLLFFTFSNYNIYLLSPRMSCITSWCLQEFLGCSEERFIFNVIIVFDFFLYLFVISQTVLYNSFLLAGIPGIFCNLFIYYLNSVSYNFFYLVVFLRCSLRTKNKFVFKTKKSFSSFMYRLAIWFKFMII